MAAADTYNPVYSNAAALKGAAKADAALGQSTGMDAVGGNNVGMTAAYGNSVGMTAANGNSVGMNAAGMDAALAQSTHMDAATGAVDPATGTVRGQLGSLLASDSPYLQQARGQAALAANDRGLVNSSMGGQAGESAAINAALPIATTDSGYYQQMALSNLNAKNAANQFNANADNTVALANQGATNTARQFNVQAQNAASQFNAQAQNQQALTNQAAQNAASQFNTQAQNQQTLTNQAAQNAANQFNASAANQQGLVNQQMANNAAQFNASSANQMALANLNAQNSANQFNAGSQNALTNLQAQGDINTQLQQMQNSNSVLLANLNNQSKQLISTNESARSLYNSSQSTISAIMTSQYLTPDEKKSMIDSEVAMLNGGLSVIDAVNAGTLNTSLGTVLSFDTSGLPSGSVSAAYMDQLASNYGAAMSATRGGGGSVICTRLHALGLLDDAVYAADCRFGRVLVLADPACVSGYRRLAGPVAEWMHGRTSWSLALARLVGWLAGPVVREMAAQGGHPGGGSRAGRAWLRVLRPLARLAAPRLAEGR